MAFSHTLGGTTFTEANFEGNAYSDEAAGFPKALEKIVEHVANAYRGTSTASITVGTGAKTLTVTNSNSQIPAFAVGMPVRVARTSDPSGTFMQGEITAWTASTGAATINVSSSKGSGTHTDWTITVGGHQTTASASPLAIADGGTGSTTAAAAATALGLGTADSPTFTRIKIGSATGSDAALNVHAKASTEVARFEPTTAGYNYSMYKNSSGSVIGYIGGAGGDGTTAGGAIADFALRAEGNLHLLGGGATIKASVTSNGLTFNGDTASANALDDYEEGTWTPDLRFGGGTTGITYAERSGRYTKIGDKVLLEGTFSLSNKGSSGGNADLYGLPFASVNPSGNVGAFCVLGAINVAIASNYYTHVGMLYQGVSYLALRQSGDNNSITTLTAGNFNNNSAVYFSLVYEV